MDEMTVTEAAGELGITERAIRYRLERKLMKGKRVGRWIWVIPKREIERWKARGRMRPGPKPKEHP